MKTLYLIIILGFMSCKSTQQDNYSDFIIKDATEQKWYGGQPGVQGTKYTITLEQTSKGKVSFDSLFIDNVWHPVNSHKENFWVVAANIPEYKKENPSILTGEEVKDNRQSDIEVKIIRPSDQASQFVGKKVLLYRFNNQKRYLVIDTFEKHETVSYP